MEPETIIADNREHLNNLKREISIVSQSLSALVVKRDGLKREITEAREDLEEIREEASLISTNLVSEMQQLQSTDAELKRSHKKKCDEMALKEKAHDMILAEKSEHILLLSEDIKRKSDRVNDLRTQKDAVEKTLGTLIADIKKKKEELIGIELSIVEKRNAEIEFTNSSDDEKRTILNDIECARQELATIKRIIKERQDDSAVIKTDLREREEKQQEREENFAIILARFVPYWNEVYPGRVLKI